MIKLNVISKYLRERSLGAVLAVAVGSLLMPSIGSAVTLKAQCYQIDAENQEVHGVAVNRRIPIGSVSKIITAYWALNVLGPDYRYNTRILISRMSQSEVDLHIQGSQDPYFGKEKLQVLVANLNKMGIKKIRLLTFDENFKYLDFPEDEKEAHKFHRTTYPAPKEVYQNLKKSFQNLMSRYAQNAKELNKVYNMKLPKSVAIRVKEIKFIPAADVNQEALASATAYSFKSTSLIQIIKEINRNSNNYASNILFESLGGDAEFSKFIQTNMSLNENDVIMVNGSGDHFFEDETQKSYNQATCVSVLKILHALRTYLKDHGNLQLQDVMAVVGGDTTATVATYTHPKTNKAVIAKTGTIDPGVALAGLASTKNGAILFASVYGTAETKRKIKVGRQKIEADLLKLLEKNGGSEKINYTARDFYQVDDSSFLELMQVLTPTAEQVAPPSAGPLTATQVPVPNLK